MGNNYNSVSILVKKINKEINNFPIHNKKLVWNYTEIKDPIYNRNQQSKI